MNRPSTFAVPCTVYSAATSLRSMGLGPYPRALKLVGECGTNLSPGRMPSTSPPGCVSLTSNKISGGKVLSSRTRRSGQPSRGAAAARRGSRRAHRHRTLGAFYSAPVRRVSKARPRRSPPRPARSPSCSTIPCVMVWNTAIRAPPNTRSVTAAASSPISRRRSEVAPKICLAGRTRGRLSVS